MVFARVTLTLWEEADGNVLAAGSLVPALPLGRLDTNFTMLDCAWTWDDSARRARDAAPPLIPNRCIAGNWGITQ